jgi:hypothetical protein
MKLLLGSLVLCCLPLAVVAADKRPVVSYQINKIEFKENGRIDSDMVLECDLKKLLENAAQPYSATGEKTRKLEERDKHAARAHFELELRIDKVARVAGQPPNRLGGSEVGVSVFLGAQTSKPQFFLCRLEGIGLLTPPSTCSRLDYCSAKLTKQIAEWLVLQPVPVSTKPE